LSLYSATSLPAAEFYIRQAKQEFSHLKSFASIFRLLTLSPEPPHASVRFLSTHNTYYPLKVFLEHALGETMVLLTLREGVLPRIPRNDLRGEKIHQMLGVVCKDEEEHVAWGLSEAKRLAGNSNRLSLAYYGLFLFTMVGLWWTMWLLKKRFSKHWLGDELPAFYTMLRKECTNFMQVAGWIPQAPTWFGRIGLPLFWAILFFVRGKFTRLRSHLDRSYIEELGL
jgi:hypothetical protein